MANDIVLVILKVVKKQNTEQVSLFFFLMQSKLMFMVIYSFDHKE